MTRSKHLDQQREEDPMARKKAAAPTSASCPTCGGSGSLTVATPHGWTFAYCPTCKGTGKKK
jgi:DnaJ-class molecular chaperone